MKAPLKNLDKKIWACCEYVCNRHDLKIRTFSLKGETNTKVAYGYLDGIINPDILAEFERRIGKLNEGEILETSYIEELIEDSTYSPFPQYRYTERPDTAVAALLDGKKL
ncbi:hypothetical protein GCM10020331_098510 [Ectobacillus funiculus]